MVTAIPSEVRFMRAFYPLSLACGAPFAAVVRRMYVSENFAGLTCFACQYGSYEEALRDFGEAERRFGMSNFGADGKSRENINRVDPTQHP